MTNADLDVAGWGRQHVEIELENEFENEEQPVAPAGKTVYDDATSATIAKGSVVVRENKHYFFLRNNSTIRHATPDEIVHAIVYEIKVLQLNCLSS